MASFVCQVQTIQRSLGRSSVAAAAYRSAELLRDERLAMEFDFRGKDGVEHAEILAPATAPVSYTDRETLWNAAEGAERRKDAVPAQEILLALPHELDLQQRRELVRAFVAEHVTRRGMIADIAMHRPGKEGDQRNFHAHILVTTREVSPEGFGKKNRDWHHSQFVSELRAEWAQIQNEHLRRHLGRDAPQVSHLSLAEQGIDRAPTVHLGPEATALERKNRASERGEQNRDVKAHNKKLRELHVQLEETTERVAARAPEVSVPIATLAEDARKLRDQMRAERDGWRADREALTAPAPVSAREIGREITAGAAAERWRAKLRLEATEKRVKDTRSKRLQLVAWIRNPARMIWAKHAELNALAKARKDFQQADAALRVRQAWLRSEKGRAYVAARRQPALDKAGEVRRTQRTLERKIKRMDRRIQAASRTYDELRLAQELGVKSLNVPASSPDATRFLRAVSTPARRALAQYPERARQMALQRLNRGRGRGPVRSISPEI